jgi:uncharacterized protein HemX
MTGKGEGEQPEIEATEEPALEPANTADEAPAKPAKRKGGGIGRVLLITVGVLGLGAAGAAYAFRDLPATATIGVNFAAKQTCSCLFVSNRSMASCETDLPTETEGLVSVAQEKNSVRASALGVFNAKAEFSEDFGCVLTE